MSCRRNRGITLCRAEAVTEKKQYKRNINGNGTEIKLEGKYKMKKLLITLLFAAGLLTACTTVLHAAENAGKAILGINPCQKEIIVTAVTADGSPVQVEGCTVTEFPSDEETILTATGTKVVLKGNITELDCSSNELTALDVRGLTALQTLYCDNNLLTSIDLHGLTALQTLYCDNNRLSSLDVRQLTALQWLKCYNNQLSVLHVQDLTSLRLLYCDDNRLTSLNLHGLSGLWFLHCDNNQLTSLDLKGLTALRWLKCRDNQLTTLNVQGLTSLQVLECDSNRLTSLNLHGLSGLQVLNCDNNQLTSLDLKGVTALQTLYCYNNRLTVLDIHGLSRLAGLYCSRNRLKEHALIQIINSLPERRTDEETEAVFYTEEDNRSEGNYTDWNSSAGLQAAIKTARAKNWTLYKQVVGEDFEELEVTEESERGTGFGGAAVPIDKTYTVKGVSFTMKGITAVTDAVLGDNSMEDNQEHSVSLSAYYIGETEVTQELWLAVMGNNPTLRTDSLKNPVEQVSWFDCIAFCNELTKKVSKLGESQCVYYSDDIYTAVYTVTDAGNSMVPHMKQEAKGFRLPTEAEWEWAAMGGKQYRWAGTDSEDELENYAWYADNSDYKAHEVKRKEANGYGLYDMSGNVVEWCWDWYDDSIPADGHTDPKGVSSGSLRVIRGGGWLTGTVYAARAVRGFNLPGDRYASLGLRVVCSVGR